MTKKTLREIDAGGGAMLKVLAGRYGPYVTDGSTNASIPKSIDPGTITLEQAQELIAARKDAVPMPRRGAGARRKPTPAKAGAKGKASRARKAASA
jgi:DNA topoisomerase-1